MGGESDSARSHGDAEKANVCGGRSTLTSAIVTLVVGRDQRLFAAHEDILSLSPFFAAALKGQFYEGSAKRVELLDEYVYGLKVLGRH